MWLKQDDADILSGRADSDPTEAVGFDIHSHFQAESVSVEAECCIRIVNRDEHGGNSGCHAKTIERLPLGTLLHSCSLSPGRHTAVRVRCGRVAILLTQGGSNS